MISVAEELLGPYIWGSYDLLVLPPSYPFGGMENPTLTFVTPTVLVGGFNALNLGKFFRHYLLKLIMFCRFKQVKDMMVLGIIFFVFSHSCIYEFENS